ncbi:MAG: hypothetical protein BWY20_00940 [Spirochaetes bacterium ADurb.Bin215]|nr:MAG: hypothetical protein BWY20_00940 [Spirochaetes bacterium ADurb.Bin215]
MKLIDLVLLLERGKRRYELVGTPQNGTLIALDVEGRLFSWLDGEVVNRVNPDAFSGFSTRAAYLNPGGDGFWPAPEGSRLGYEYSTGSWRVPPSLTNARWQVLEKSENSLLAAAEIDLINSEGRGIPCLFSRRISLEFQDGAMLQKVTESIRYLGRKTLSKDQALLAPWSLCQFDCDAECQLLLPPCPASEIWDLYTPESSCHRKQTQDGWQVAMKTDFRFQLGLSEKVNGLEFCDKRRHFKVQRTAVALAEGLSYIDIADQDPANEPNGRPVRFSAYCDPSGFMEIEAAGGTPNLLTPDCVSELQVNTTFARFF